MSIPIFNDIRERTSSRFQARARRVQGDIRGRIRSFDRVRSVMRFSLRWRTSRPVVGKHDVATYHAHTHTQTETERVRLNACEKKTGRRERDRVREKERRVRGRSVHMVYQPDRGSLTLPAA